MYAGGCQGAGKRHPEACRVIVRDLPPVQRDKRERVVGVHRNHELVRAGVVTHRGTTCPSGAKVITSTLPMLTTAILALHHLSPRSLCR